METKVKNDIETVMTFIKMSPEKEHIVRLYLNGPPENEGFMWWNINNDYRYINNKNIINIKKKMDNMVFDLGWDSSGFALFHREIQKHVKQKYSNIDSFN